MKKLIIIFLIFLTSLQAQAFEDIILSTDGKISNIKIENASIININPLTTIQNERNTLFITPVKTGETNFSLKKMNKIYNFNVNVEENKTIISENETFEIIPLDTHPSILDYQVDLPPVLRKKETINIDGAVIEVDQNDEEAK